MEEVAEEVITIGLSFSSQQDSAFLAFKNHLIEVGATSSPKVEFVFTTADSDVGKQAADVQDLIRKKVDAIAIIAQDSLAIASSIKECNDADIPVVLCMRPANPDAEFSPNATIKVDAFDQGYASTKFTLQKMKDDGITEAKIIVVSGDIRDENSTLRVAGCEKAAAEFGAEILTEVPTDWDPEKAKSGLSAVLQANLEANCIFFCSDILVTGGLVALEAAGRWVSYGDENFMYIATCDVFKEAMGWFDEKLIVSDTLFDIKGLGEATVETLIKLVAGEEMDNEIVAVSAPVYTWDNYKDQEMIDKLWD